MERSKFCHLTVDRVDKPAYVWHEANWIFNDEWHSHQMGQLIYVEKGIQYLHTKSRTYLLPTHHCAWIPSGLSHKTSTNVSQVHLRCIFYSLEKPAPFFEELSIFNTPTVLREMILFTRQWSRLEELDEVESDFLRAIIGILPHSANKALPLVIPVPQNPRLSKIRDYLSSHIHEQIIIPKLAADSNLSARTMERLFKLDTGITLAGYIKLYKMIKAVELLSIMGETVKTVALKVGYNSVSTFSNTFQKVLGLRPQEMLTGRLTQK